MCYGHNEMLMPHSLISLKTLLSSLCRKKAEACAVGIFIIAFLLELSAIRETLRRGCGAERY